MSLTFLDESPEVAFRKLEKDLKVAYPTLNLDRFKGMSARKLGEQIEKLEHNEQRFVTEGRYGSWLTNDDYLMTRLLREALEHLKAYKEIKESKEVLVPGFTYYRGTKQFGPILEGKKCLWLGEDRPYNWVNFRQKTAVAKAFEVIRHGSVDDFKNIYVGLADGRADALVNVTESHITESSASALKEIEAYCDKRWSGPWPWEAASPYKLRNKIEEKELMRKLSIQEMKARFDDLLFQLNEGEVEAAEVKLYGRDMVEKIQGMIEDLGKLSGEGVLTLKDMARTAIGDDAASQIEQAVQQPLNQAADMLSKLKVAVDKAVQGLGQGGMGAPGGMAPGGDEMGIDSPEAALGGVGGPNPADDMADQMAGVNPDDMEAAERAKKVA